MQALPGSDVSLTTEEGVRRLRFATTLVNVGTGPLELRPDVGVGCPPDQRGSLQWTYIDANGNGVFDQAIDTGGEPNTTGCMLFHPTHDHWHFDASARYVLSPQGSTDPIVVSDKVSFCMRDSDPLPGAAAAPKTYGECTRDSIQGISSGWVDVYEARLDGQALPLPPELPDGPYCLQITVDPHSLIRESHEGDNVSVTGVTIQGRQAVVGPATGCA
jgi:Lysyl oxidase